MGTPFFSLPMQKPSDLGGVCASSTGYPKVQGAKLCCCFCFFLLIWYTYSVLSPSKPLLPQLVRSYIKATVIFELRVNWDHSNILSPVILTILFFFLFFFFAIFLNFGYYSIILIKTLAQILIPQDAPRFYTCTILLPEIKKQESYRYDAQLTIYVEREDSKNYFGTEFNHICNLLVYKHKPK